MKCKVKMKEITGINKNMEYEYKDIVLDGEILEEVKIPFGSGRMGYRIKTSIGILEPIEKDTVIFA
jgi:hypothetical protein